MTTGIHTHPSASTRPCHGAAHEAEALIAQWDALPLRDRGVVKDRLQAIVASLAAVIVAGNKVDAVWPGSVLDTLIRVEVEKAGGRCRASAPMRSNHMREG